MVCNMGSGRLFAYGSVKHWKANCGHLREARTLWIWDEPPKTNFKANVVFHVHYLKGSFPWVAGTKYTTPQCVWLLRVKDQEQFVAFFFVLSIADIVCSITQLFSWWLYCFGPNVLNILLMGTREKSWLMSDCHTIRYAWHENEGLFKRL